MDKLSGALPSTSLPKSGKRRSRHTPKPSRSKRDAAYRIMIDGVTGYAIFTLSPTGYIETWTPGAQRVFGYSSDDVVGIKYDIIFTEEDRARGAPSEELVVALTDQYVEVDRWHLRKDGSRFWGTNTVQPLRDDVGELSGFTKIVRDITAQHELAEALNKSEKRLSMLVDTLRHKAYYDVLTGLPNRSLFSEHLLRTIAHHRRLPGGSFAVFFLDLDRFKLVNDGLGHAFADQLLIQFGQRLLSSFRGEDIVSRIGGDEFAILLSDLNEQSEAAAAAERLQRILTTAFVINGKEVFASASIGIAIGGTQSTTPDEMLRNADIAMYAAKTQGRGQYAIFNNMMHANIVALHALETDLRYALQRNELRIVYQPIVTLTDGRVVGFEALVRWNHPSRGMLSPDAFISAAEDTGVVIGIDRWVLAQSCREISEWNRQHKTDKALTVSVNFSSKHFMLPDTIRHIEKVLEDTALPSTLLKIEITERVLLEHSSAIDVVLKVLRNLGIEIYIDDFGTGYSSLNYLRYLPVNVLKIDQSFVQTMGDDSESFAIVRTIVALSESLRLHAMAEGIETNDQRSALLRLKCEYGQGYLFSKALPWNAASRLVEHQLPYVS